MIGTFRKWDKIAMHLIVVPFVMLLAVKASNYADAEQVSPQDVVNQHVTDKMLAFDQRLDHLEKIGDSQFVALLGILAALLVGIVQNKNKRGQR